MNIYDFFLPKSKTFYLEDNATIRQALEKFDYHKFSVVPVIDQDGKFITTISEGDILRFIKNEFPEAIFEPYLTLKGMYLLYKEVEK